MWWIIVIIALILILISARLVMAQVYDPSSLLAGMRIGANSRPGRTWYVDGTSGSNSNDGTTWSTARQTITSGLLLLTAGDLLVIGPGNYVENVAFNVANVVITGMGQPSSVPGYTGTMITGNCTVTALGVHIFNVAFVMTAGVALHVVPTSAITGPFIENCFFWSVGTVAVHLDASGAAISNARIDGCFFDNLATTAQILADGANGVRHSIICNNTINQLSAAPAIHFNDAGVRYFDVHHNYLNGGNNGTYGIYIQDGQDGSIHHNTAVNFATAPFLEAAAALRISWSDNNYGISIGGELNVTGLNIAAIIQITGTITIPHDGYYVIRVRVINGVNEALGLTGGVYTIVARDTATAADSEYMNDNAVRLTAAMSLDRSSRPVFIPQGATIGVWVLGQAGDIDVDARLWIYES